MKMKTLNLKNESMEYWGVQIEISPSTGSPQNVLRRDLAVFKQQRAGIARAYSKFILLLTDGEPLETPLDDERGGAAVPLLTVFRMVHVLGAVSYTHLTLPTICSV